MNLCFVCLHAYPLFQPDSAGSFGGSEFRAWTFARALAGRGKHRLSFVVLDHGQPPLERRDGVDLIAHQAYPAEPTPLGPVGRFARRVATRLSVPAGIVGGFRIPKKRLAPYEAVPAEAFVVFGVSNVAAELALHCRNAKAALVVFAGSDLDFSEHNSTAAPTPNAYGSIGSLCHYAIRAARCVVVQTEAQRRLARERFGIDAVLVRNPIALQDAVQPREPQLALWIGKSDSTKRPDVLCRLARRMPEVSFLMLMNRADGEIYDRIKRDLPANVRLVERLTAPEAEALFAGAFVLINTSAFEGFPNTFLQAGKYGVPVLSLAVDPDGYLRAHECGVVAEGSEDRLAAGLARLRSDPGMRADMGARHRHYVETFHRLEDRVDELEDVLMGVTTDG